MSVSGAAGRHRAKHSLYAAVLLVTGLIDRRCYSQVLHYWPFGEPWCRIWLAVDVWMCTASIYNLVAISVDRYIAVSRPIRYASLMSPSRAKLLIVAVWILSFVICFPPLIGWNGGNTRRQTSSSSAGELDRNRTERVTRAALSCPGLRFNFFNFVSFHMQGGAKSKHCRSINRSS